jgi:hypothetical protein
MIAAARFAGGEVAERPTIPPRRRPRGPKPGPAEDSVVVLRGILALIDAGFTDDEICVFRRIRPRMLQLAKARLRKRGWWGAGGAA